MPGDTRRERQDKQRMADRIDAKGCVCRPFGKPRMIS
jgi:hypothetical protein